jgi:hypothetical protein
MKRLPRGGEERGEIQRWSNVDSRLRGLFERAGIDAGTNAA